MKRIGVVLCVSVALGPASSAAALSVGIVHPDPARAAQGSDAPLRYDGIVGAERLTVTYTSLGFTTAGLPKGLVTFQDLGGGTILARGGGCYGSGTSRVLCPYNRNDPFVVVNGGVGNDLLDLRGWALPGPWGRGYSEINGGAGNDRLLGGYSVDALSGGDGADELRGGEDFDILNGGEGADRLFGDDAADFVMDGDSALRHVVDRIDCGDSVGLVDWGYWNSIDIVTNCEDRYGDQTPLALPLTPSLPVSP